MNRTPQGRSNPRGFSHPTGVMNSCQECGVLSMIVYARLLAGLMYLLPAILSIVFVST